ncbi:MAG: DinB family protein [Gemmatimonadetes bacterium]|nr:DinB family protein [Gemmatimonadota bacterium]
MHPRLVEITGYLATVRADVTRELAPCTPEQLHRTSGTNRWSAAQVVEHLGRVEGSTAKLLEGLFARAMEGGGLPEDHETSSLLGSLDRWNVTSRRSRIEAPERLVPSPRPDFAVAWASLQKARERTLAVVASVDGRDLTRVSFKHPVLDEFNGYEWILFIGQHGARHLDQMREALHGR